jgi:hypothetical protein
MEGRMRLSVSALEGDDGRRGGGLTFRVSSARSTALQRTSEMSSIHRRMDREGGEDSMEATNSPHLRRRGRAQRRRGRAGEAEEEREGGKEEVERRRCFLYALHVAPLTELTSEGLSCRQGRG